MSTTAFGLGSKYFALYEVAGVGIQWHTFSQSPVEGDDFNLLLSMMMLVVDAVVYGVLTWYIEAVHPGTCGQRGVRAPRTLTEASLLEDTCPHILICWCQPGVSIQGPAVAKPGVHSWDSSPPYFPLWRHLSCSLFFSL